MSSGFPLVIGHRGARGLYPENTQRGFETALALGVDELELDLVVSGDGQLIVSHEAWLNPDICSDAAGRPIEPNTREHYNLYRMPYAEIAQFDCGRRGHPDFPHQEKRPSVKPLFTELLDALNTFASAQHLAPPNYLIEIKCGEDPDGLFNPPPDEFAQQVYRLLQSKNQLRQCRLQSFDPRVLNALYRLDNNLKLALLVENSLDLQRDLARLNFQPQAYSPDHTLLEPSIVSACHALGMRVIPWTVNEPGDMDRLIAIGVDGLITDYPDRLLTLKSTPTR